MKKVLYYEFTNKYTVHVVKSLRNNHSWQPVYMAGTSVGQIEKFVKENQFHCILQDTMKLRQAQFDYSKIGSPIPIDANIINSLSKFSLNFLGILADSSGWNFSFEERKSFYYDILKYWNTVITHLKPDLVVFFTWPHSSSCYPLYLLCKYYFKLDVLFIDPNPLLGKTNHFVGTSIEQLHSPFMKGYESSSKEKPSKEILYHLKTLRSADATIPKYISNVYMRDKDAKIKIYTKFIRLFLSNLYKGKGFMIGAFEFKKNRKNYCNLKSRMNNFQILIFWMRMRRNNINLMKIYNKICVEPNYSLKYLYFASPYQPEANTATNSGPYEQIFLVLDILSKSVPSDWVIYFKEHPATFLEKFKGSLKRDKNFYNKLLKYNNVQIIRSDIDTFKLIKNSQAVSTVAGTVGWEAAVLSKPVLAFGSSWYQGCKSIFTINSLVDAKFAINKILNGYQPDAKDIERYAAIIEKVSYKKIIHNNFYEEILKAKNPIYEMKRIANMIYDAYKIHYCNKGN